MIVDVSTASALMDASTEAGPARSHSSGQCYLTAARVRSICHIRESSMSHAEYASKPLALLTKLAAILRIVPALKFVFAKFAALLRSRESGEPLVSEFLGEAPGVTRPTVDQQTAVLRPFTDHVVAAPETNDQSDTEKLIRRRWLETGIKMWNPEVHGAGHAALNIQGRAELLSPKPGETLPGYDKLEFKMVQCSVNGQAVNRIVCEGVIIDSPTRRN
jgi:hypothetical protein